MAIYYSYFHERLGYKFSLTVERMNAAPQWKDADDFPPLPPRIAMANSEAFLRRLLFSEVGKFSPKFSSCALTLGEGGRWYYVVSWFVPDIEADFDWSTITVPVLLDGSIPEPLRFNYDDRSFIYRHA